MAERAVEKIGGGDVAYMSAAGRLGLTGLHPWGITPPPAQSLGRSLGGSQSRHLKSLSARRRVGRRQRTQGDRAYESAHRPPPQRRIATRTRPAMKFPFPKGSPEMPQRPIPTRLRALHDLPARRGPITGPEGLSEPPDWLPDAARAEWFRVVAATAAYHRAVLDPAPDLHLTTDRGDVEEDLRVPTMYQPSGKRR